MFKSQPWGNLFKLQPLVRRQAKHVLAHGEGLNSGSVHLKMIKIARKGVFILIHAFLASKSNGSNFDGLPTDLELRIRQ